MCWNGQGITVSTEERGKVKPHKTPSLERFPRNWKGATSLCLSPESWQLCSEFFALGCWRKSLVISHPCPSPTSFATWTRWHPISGGSSPHHPGFWLVYWFILVHGMLQCFLLLLFFFNFIYYYYYFKNLL